MESTTSSAESSNSEKKTDPIQKGSEADWNRFIRLGEMIGDGLHNEPGGKWISRDYKALAKFLIPEDEESKRIKLDRRRRKNAAIDEQMQTLLTKHKCQCSGSLKQSRSGSKVAYCEVCNSRYVARARK